MKKLKTETTNARELRRSSGAPGKREVGQRTVGVERGRRRRRERERKADIAGRVGRVGLPSWPGHYARSLIKLGEMSKDSATLARRTMRTQIITSSSFCPGMSPGQPPSPLRVRGRVFTPVEPPWKSRPTPFAGRSRLRRVPFTRISAIKTSFYGWNSPE